MLLVILCKRLKKIFLWLSRVGLSFWQIKKKKKVGTTAADGGFFLFWQNTFPIWDGNFSQFATAKKDISPWYISNIFPVKWQSLLNIPKKVFLLFEGEMVIENFKFLAIDIIHHHMKISKIWKIAISDFFPWIKTYRSDLCLLFCWQVGKGEKSWGFFAKLCQLLWLSGHQILFYFCGQLYGEVKLQRFIPTIFA